LNLSPGVINCVQALRAIASAIPIEKATVMDYARTGPYALSEDPSIWTEFSAELSKVGFNEKLELVGRHDFYKLAAEDNVCLVIATGEMRIYANIALTIGVRRA